MLAFGDSNTVAIGASVPAVTGYPALLATALGIGMTNYAVGGVGMNNPGNGILAQMLSVSPPSRNVPCVMIIGTNDMGVYGPDPTKLAEFSVGLRSGLQHLTSKQRIPEPRTFQERLLFKKGKLPAVDDGCSVWVGNTPKQVTGSYVGAGSPAVQALYVAQIAADIAWAQSQGWRVYGVDVSSAYDPNTMGNEPPSQIHFGDTGHLAVKNAFYAAMQARGV